MLTLAERHVGDFAKAGAVVLQRPDIAPVHILGASLEVVAAERGEAFEHRVDLGLG